MTRSEILAQAKTMREQEVADYQFQIDTYVIAIEHSANNTEMTEFREHMQNMLEANRKEQAKAQLMLDVINIQISQLP
jgi:ribosomal protein S3AE